MWKERSAFIFAKSFKIKALLSLEMLENENSVTWRHVPAEWNPQILRSENFTTRKALYIYIYIYIYIYM
jgi:hypothetical protein